MPNSTPKDAVDPSWCLDGRTAADSIAGRADANARESGDGRSQVSLGGRR